MKLLIPILFLLMACDKPVDITPIEYRIEFTGICDAQGDCPKAVLVTFESESKAKLQIEGVLPCDVCLIQFDGVDSLDIEQIEEKYYSAYITIPAGKVLNLMVSLKDNDLPTNGDYSYFGDWFSRVQFEQGYKWRQVYSKCN